MIEGSAIFTNPINIKMMIKDFHEQLYTHMM